MLRTIPNSLDIGICCVYRESPGSFCYRKRRYRSMLKLTLPPLISVTIRILWFLTSISMIISSWHLPIAFIFLHHMKVWSFELTNKVMWFDYVRFLCVVLRKDKSLFWRVIFSYWRDKFYLHLEIRLVRLCWKISVQTLYTTQILNSLEIQL